MNNINIRQIDPTDYSSVISVVNEWWGGRNMNDMLPKLFFVHFRATSFVAEKDGNIVGFLVGFVSQTYPNEAYIHFSGVHPAFRKQGIGHELYEHFFKTVKKLGCTVVRCVTSPVNKGSVAFHQRLGFATEPSKRMIEGIPVVENYDGRCEDRVLFFKLLEKIR